MKVILSIFLVIVGFAYTHAEEGHALNKIFAERDQELRRSIDQLENEMAQMTRRISMLKTHLVAGPKGPENGQVIVEVRNDATLVAGKAISVNELGEKLRAISAVNQYAWVQLVAAPEVTWANLQPSLQACFDAKIGTFEFVIKQAE